jgi:hypothetical protein
MIENRKDVSATRCPSLPVRAFAVAFVAATVLLPPALNGAESPKSVRQRLLAPGFESEGMTKIFALGSAAVPLLVEALDDPEREVSDKAQRMLRLIGDEAGIRALHDWYGTPRPETRVVGSPVAVPIQEWDFRQIERVLDEAPQSFAKTSESYLLALAIDGSPRAERALARAFEALGDRAHSITVVPPVMDHIAAGREQARACVPGKPEAFLRGNSFFLSPEDQGDTTIRLLAQADEKKRALLATSQIFGGTYLIVLRNTGGCWRFLSVEHYAAF